MLPHSNYDSGRYLLYIEIQQVMKNTYLYFLAFLLTFSACRKEEVIQDEPIIEEEMPTEVEGLFVSGQITDNDNVMVAGAVVRFYQGGEQVGESVTDAEGFYDSADIPLVDGEEVTLAIEEETYTAKYKRLDPKEEGTREVDLRLINKDNAFLGHDDVLKNPGDTSLVKVFGTFTEKNGFPIDNAHVIVAWEFEVTSSGSLQVEGVYDLTDENGYVEFLVPVGEEVFFLALPSLETSLEIGSCAIFISEEEVNVLSWGLYWDNIGIITTEHELLEKENLDFDGTQYIFSGEFQNCDGSPVSAGEAVLSISYPVGQDTITKTFRTKDFGPNGEYSFETNLCEYGGELDVNLKLTNQDTFGTELLLENTPVGGMQFDTQQACDDFRLELLPCLLNINIGSDHSFALNFERIANPHPSFALAQVHDGIIGFNIFRMSDITLGINPIEELHIGWFGNDPFSFASYSTLTADVTKFSDGEIIGTISGNAETAELGTQEITGDFIVRYE